ncbi:MAG TPA: toprim domain-containing protein, partial [Nitrospira sp.]
MKTFEDFQIDLGGRTGEEVATTCPQCSASRKNKLAKCLSVNTVKGVWCCHHCDWRGSLKSGEESRSKPPKRIVKPQFNKPSVVPPVVREWFGKRGIPEETVAQHCISLQTVYMPQVEDEVPCLVFPYYRNGEVVNLKYRTVEGKFFRQVKDAEKILNGLDDIVGETTIIVEGEIDKLSCAVAGFTSCVSVPDGAPPEGSKSSEIKFEYLVNCEAYLTKLKKIIIAVDNDGPGKTLEEELARRLGPDRCWRVTWPEGCKDANDVLVKHGAVVLRQCIETARPFPIEGVFEVVDLVDDAIALYDRGLPAGLSTGVSSIDRHYSVKAGELTIVTGIPSHGKSEWLDWLMVQLAILYGWTFSICSPENYPLARHLAKLVEKYIGKPFPKGPNPRMTPFELAQGLQWAQDHFIFVGPEEAISIDCLITKAKSLVARRGIRGLVLD